MSLRCTEAQHWWKLQQSSHSILHPPHPSCTALPHSLTHCISSADWDIPTRTDLEQQGITVRLFPVFVHTFILHPSSSALPSGSFCLDSSVPGSEAVDLRVRVRSWTREEQGVIKESGSLNGSPDWCLFGPGGMGCTTSTVVFDGLRTVLERNCSGYICKGAAEPVGPSEAERALSRRESRILPTPRVLKVCVSVRVCADTICISYVYVLCNTFK